MKSKIFIQPSVQNFDEFLAYAKEHDYNLEIASFSFGDVLDAYWESFLNEYKKKLKNFSGIISVHGVFLDIILHSRDKKIRKIAEERIYHNLEIAKALKAKYIVFHPNFNPLINQESYRKNWLKKHTEFWKKATDEYNIIIVLENIWEPNPNLYKELLNRVNSPFLKICLDTGHVNIFSEIPISEWFSVLKNNIIYIHVNDNEGKVDNELIPGEGNINWKEFSISISENRIEPNIIFEVGSLDKTIKSINYFKDNKIYPFK